MSEYAIVALDALDEDGEPTTLYVNRDAVSWIEALPRGRSRQARCELVLHGVAVTVLEKAEDLADILERATEV